MTQLQIQKEEFLAYRSATVFLLYRVASADIRILMFFGKYGCLKLVSLYCSGERTKPEVNNL